MIQGKDMCVRPAKESDLSAWASMRSQLWPDCADQHVAELEAYFAGSSIDIEQCFVVDGPAADLIGFMELNIRNFAEGSRQAAVPYVEAWYIKPAYQGQGLGSQLIQQGELWARKLGYDELASDTETDNHKSIAMHQHLGFEEIERVVCFLKKLKHE